MVDLARLIATDLPVAAHLAEVREGLAGRGALVLKAEPGAGKTSLVPLALASDEGIRRKGKVLVLEPRRVAAAQAAARAAELLGSAVGAEAGYRVRGDSHPGSAVEFVTEGVFIRMIQEDPGLEGVGALVFDEFHERSLNADLALALALETREALRPDLGLLLMSATLETGRLAAFVGGEVLEVPGRSFPVETRYRPIPEGGRFEEAFAAELCRLQAEVDGDLLAFLPGVKEIERTARDLGAILPDRAPVRVLPLHGSLSLEAQRRVIRPEGKERRIILATSVAETSLTVPGIRAVLDSGLARLTRFEARTGLNRLVTEREANDRAEQRRGRAGRLGPGLCLRAWPESELLPETTQAEILRAELSGLVLEAAVWGAVEASGLRWLDAPPASAWNAATELLAELGCIDAGGRASEFGRRAARLGTEPRLAAMVLKGAEAGRLREAASLAAILGDRGSSDADLDGAIEALERGDPAYAGARAEASRLCAAARLPSGRAGEPSRQTGGSSGSSGSRSLLLAAAFPDRVAKRIEARGIDASFQLPGGRRLKAKGALASAEWLVAAEADSGLGTEGRVFAGVALSEGEALEALAPLFREEAVLTWEGLVPRSRTKKMAGAICLGESAKAAPAREAVAQALAQRIASEGLGILPWEGDNAAAERLLARMRWYGAVAAPEDWPELSETALARDATVWLSPFVSTPGAAITPRGLKEGLAALIPGNERGRFARDVPESLELPSGRRQALDYVHAPSGPEGRVTGPLLEAKPQELYGLDKQPTILGLAIVIRLLSPAGRPIHTTSDLPGFWRGSWLEVRKDMRGRYPKHDWPEDPSAARPSVASVKRRA
jgi:ATP-dependent helicase HrpB